MNNRNESFDAFATTIAGAAGAVFVMSVAGGVYAHNDYEQNVKPEILRAKEEVDYPADEQIQEAKKY